MKILVTGNLGYVGSILVEELSNRNYNVIGYDSGLFKKCNLTDTPFDPKTQILKDIRKVSADDLKGIDAIIHLAALSNDPLGELSHGITEEINLESSYNLASLAKKVGIKRFVFASSLSMYGVSNLDEELEEDFSEKKPVTSYAKTKWEAECKIKKLVDKNFCVSFFRPSTIFGVSPRLRCDIVYNNLISCAYTTGKIEIKSDGSPWRPVVHIRDVCNALICGIEAPEYLVSGEAFNVGIKNGNFTIKDLADAAKKVIPSCEVIYTNEHLDFRTYKISFKKFS